MQPSARSTSRVGQRVAWLKATWVGMPAGPARKKSCTVSSVLTATSQRAIASARVRLCTVGTSVCSSPPRASSPRMPNTPPARCTSSMWYFGVFGATLHSCGTRRDSASMACRSKSTSASCAAASRCRMVLVEPPMAMSSVIAFSNAARVAMPRGRAPISSPPYQRWHSSTIRRPARRNSCSRSACVARVEPFPGSDRPRASVRQFIELAVNMPEHEPQVGQALRSYSATFSSLALSSAAITIASTRSSLCSDRRVLPASIGPPETNTTGMFRRSAAISMPGVILSQLEMHTSASAQCALTMYSTESAMISRLGSEYSMPSWPMAIPSSTAMVLNSFATPPTCSISRATSWPRSLRCTWPGTNWVNELATAMIGLWKSPSVIPVARHRARAPAMLRPAVEVRERYSGMVAGRIWRAVGARFTSILPKNSGCVCNHLRRCRAIES